ncbi:Sec-independent protein translocase protein TatB [Orbaceae bacterium ac157xtp]
MFDVSFGELLLVLIIGLIVLGPKRLPEAIKTVASWINALRRLTATVQLEINKELKLQELQDSLRNAEKSGLDSITPEIKESIAELKRVTQSLQNDINLTSTNSNNHFKSENSLHDDELAPLDNSNISSKENENR